MRYSTAHKAETRARIIAAAGEAFREHGFDGIGVVDVMKRAGLTHGGFYAHFASKDELIVETLRQAFADARDRLQGRRELAGLIARYLSPEHRDATGRGCAVAALGSDMARLDPAVKGELGGGIAGWLSLYADAAGDRDEGLVMICAMVGAMQVARATADPAASDAILERVRRVLVERFAPPEAA